MTGTERRHRRWIALIAAQAAVTMVGVAAPTAAAATPETSFISTADCQEHQAFIQGDPAAVAARLPKRYAPLTDPASGAPVLFVRALNCAKVAFDGSSAPATIASYGIVINSPDGSGCGSAAPVVGAQRGDFPPICNWYPLAWVSSDARATGWLRDGTPDFPAYTVPGLVFKMGAFDVAQGGAPMHFEAPAPSPSRFTMDEVGRARPGSTAVRGNYWRDTAAGTVRLRFSTPGLTSGDTTGTVTASAGSELAQVMGATKRPYLASYSSLSAEHWDYAAYRKQVESAGDAGQGFAGSCSIEGDSSFSPPAGNTSQALTYDYAGSGTCNGTLNGKALQNAAVQLRQTGHSYGGCQGAYTTEPGLGTITFPDGTVLPYTLDFSFNGSEGDFTLYGIRAGIGGGHGSFFTSRTTAQLFTDCAGDQVSKAPLDWSFTTQSALVAAPASTGTPGSPAGRGAKLRVSARPRRVAAGRRTLLRFRVTDSERRPVPNAAVSVGGRRGHSDSAGRLRLRVLLKRPGRAMARVTRPGFDPARVTILVRG